MLETIAKIRKSITARETKLARSGRWAESGLVTKRIPNTNENKAKRNPKRYKQTETGLNHDGDDARMI